MNITAAQLLTIAPSASPAFVASMVQFWPSLSREYGLTDADVPHSLAHIAAETQGYTRLEENLTYTTTARLRAVWPSRFKSDAAAAPYVRNPQKLANLVYGGRLGNTGPNDGWLYRGSGCKQTTGKTNFAAVERATGLRCVIQPELLRSFPAALESALVYWRDHKLSRIVAAGGDVVAKLTKAIQGGTGGLADRRTYTARALKVFGTTLVQPRPADDLAWISGTMLRNGSRGDNVGTLQMQLRSLGYAPGVADGIFGDATEQAVRLFQSQHGLVADGIVGPATIAMLNYGNASDYNPHAADPLREPSGLDKFLTWLAGLFRR